MLQERVLMSQLTSYPLHVSAGTHCLLSECTVLSKLSIAESDASPCIQHNLHEDDPAMLRCINLAIPLPSYTCIYTPPSTSNAPRSE